MKYVGIGLGLALIFNGLAYLWLRILGSIGQGWDVGIAKEYDMIIWFLALVGLVILLAVALWTAPVSDQSSQVSFPQDGEKQDEGRK